MIHTKQWYGLFVCAAMAVAHCAKPPPPPAKPSPEDIHDEEDAGVDTISETIRDFNQNLRAKQFDQARRLLARADRMATKADELTQSHPDFGDLVETIQDGRARLELAVEQDRYERRERAITDLIRRGKSGMKRASALFAEISQRIPNEKDLDKIQKLLSAFLELKSEGTGFMDEVRFVTHAERRDEQMRLLSDLQAQVKWRVDANKVVHKSLSVAAELAKKATNSEKLDDKITLHDKAAAAFQACASAVDAIAQDTGYSDRYETNSPFGIVTYPTLAKRCSQAVKQNRQSAAVAAWQRGVLDAAASANTVMKKLETVEEAFARYHATHAVVKGLGDCADKLKSTEKQPGYNRREGFDTAFGKLSATSLRKRCQSEQRKQRRLLPSLQKEFVKTCRGDEQTLVKEKGVPGAIETSKKGRIFVYAGEGGPERFHFNLQGQRFDPTKKPDAPTQKGKSKPDAAKKG